MTTMTRTIDEREALGITRAPLGEPAKTTRTVYRKI